MTDTTFDALVTRRTTEHRYVTFLAPAGAPPETLADHAVARAMDTESGWSMSECDWAAELSLDAGISVPIPPDYEAVERLRSVTSGDEQTPHPVDAALATLRQAGFLASLWHIDNVRTAQQRLDDPRPLSDEDCRAILDRIERDHDAEIGISWGTIQDAIEDHLARLRQTEATS